MLPVIKNMKKLDLYTPTAWQTVLLRNVGLVSDEKLAEVLGTDAQTVRREAERLGIGKISYDPNWKKLGYINIIKNNWHLLPYEQLLALLEMSEEELAYCLKEDDFLGIKLGSYKACADEIKYSPLTSDEAKETERIAALVRKEFIEDYAKPFEFYKAEAIRRERSSDGDGFDKIVYSYSMLYGDTFLEGDEIVPDEMLERLRAVGVNGLWMQGVLSKLSPYPFVEGLDEGYEQRRENLKKIIEKCAKYGIGVYLYFNEPRGVSEHQLTERTERLKGRFFNDTWSLCTTHKEVQDYLYGAVRSLAEAVPELAGIITITMSENMTNCHSRRDNTCPYCSHLRHADVVPEINNIIQRAVSDADVNTRVIANLWAWTKPYQWSEEELLEGIRRMDKRIDILSVSEMGGVIINGERVEVKEYALSKIGPCEETKRSLSFARELGHKVMAKVQVNSSWEFAVVPYVPVFELIMEHMQNLKKLGIGGLMMSWTVGGYPTVSLDLVDRFFEGDFDYDTWLCEHFGERAEDVKNAVSCFSRGFRHYPHTIGTLYHGAQELGASNLWYKEKTGYHATMVTYAFDDYNMWRGAYSVEEFLKLLDSLLDEWKKGLDIIGSLDGNEAFSELRRFAEVVYVNIKSMAVQTRYNLARDEGRFDEIPAFLKEEGSLTRRLYALAARDARIGYEASNHYYFTENSFIEKIICLDRLEREFCK